MSEVKNIKDQKLLYHLTSAENLDGIFREGLKPRAALTNFIDIADSEILKNAKPLSLIAMCPSTGLLQIHLTGVCSSTDRKQHLY